MARGWESKAVESQIQEAAQVQVVVETPVGSVEAFEKQHKLGNLKLIRSQLLDQLSRARSVSHRQLLHQSLREVEEQIAAL